LPDYFWDDLISYIEEGLVVPILGQELLRLEVGGVNTTLHRHLAERLANELSVPTDRLPPNYGLSQVICAHPPFRERRQTIYPRIKSILDKAVVPVPEPLRQLAGIGGFRLFVSTTFDTLLEQALNEERFDGRPQTTALAYAPNHVRDLPEDYANTSGPLVFQLMGRISASPDYAATEGDLLEFMHLLQSADTRPKRLLDELRQRHLLFLGNSFSDWLQRFFLRIAKSDRLWNRRDKMEIVADEQVPGDDRLSVFLNQFSQETTIFCDGSAVDFVRILHQKWQEKHPPVPDKPPDRPEPAADPDAMRPGAIFLSYSRTDTEAAKRLKSGLETIADVWFDQQKLEAGDEYEKKIQKHIRRCSLFVPMISQNTEQRQEGFFRKEWYWATQRLPEFTGTDRVFVVPVVIDDTPPYEAQVPDEFKRFNWSVALGGAAPAAFLEQMRASIRDLRKREKGGV
jgi:hypothetical protein